MTAAARFFMLFNGKCVKAAAPGDPHPRDTPPQICYTIPKLTSTEVSAMRYSNLAPLFAGWDETMIWSCLQGHMGCVLADNEAAPTSAAAVVGGFCFFAGRPDERLVRAVDAAILVPQTPAWQAAIESVWGLRAEKIFRYAMKKEPDVFDLAKLTACSAALPTGFTLRPIDDELHDRASREEWSFDLCSQFADAEDFLRRGVGVAVLHGGELVAGASSYTVYDGGIEIEIDTKPAYRNRGLASACGARLILTCLDRGLYPSWDAHDLRSVALAEKLGYHLDRPYIAYLLQGAP